jgi:hypothetical protein
MNKFEVRFKSFVSGLADCRVVDDGFRRGVADFLLNGGRICAELKCLDMDTVAKLQAFATELIDACDLPVYGTIPFDRIIAGQEDRATLNRKAIYKVAQRLETDFRDANNK